MPQTKMQTNTGALTAIFSLLILGAFIACQSEPQKESVPEPTESVAVNWTWKRTVKNDVNGVYGTVQNKIDKPIKEVVLEFRTQNNAGETLASRTFVIKDLPVGGQKPFTQDYPAREAQEDSGFVKVIKVIPGE